MNKIKREDKKMIKDMTPQAFPLWVVPEELGEPLLVVGWVPVAGDDVLAPVVVPLAEYGMSPFVWELDFAIFADREDALAAAARRPGGAR